ncbi:hypothetical protein [Actinoplanes xinjiangensis]|jgi:hypothetical protein|uniref:Uncharacterized protein n=1 Tax=Actinoplanes xinjiangensis TaxID=512350 RepID=A0A316F1L8_9ACTN|nr:hypothetical protein [Actinoplanes xinjiangensis]PWK29584.1 hypothetical protein BC793_14517 [Actinoplanes xinjiangensis]GIF44940.1 hypothetical protein Axi01nite_92510 [Actinoplanes xinjiangensis]
MSTEDFSEFDRAYQSLLAKVWGDEAALAALLADPKRFAVEAGLPVDPAATVTVDRTQPEELLTRTEILQAFNGTPGTHVLRVPEHAPIDLSELTDDDLELIAAGGNNNINLYQSK